MDPVSPVSLTNECLSLISAITKITVTIPGFIRKCRDARGDLVAVSGDLSQLATILEIYKHDSSVMDHEAVPRNLQGSIQSIMRECFKYLEEFDQVLAEATKSNGLVGVVVMWVKDSESRVASICSRLSSRRQLLSFTNDLIHILRESVVILQSQIQRLFDQIAKQNQSTLVIDDFIASIEPYAESVMDDLETRPKIEEGVPVTSRGNTMPATRELSKAVPIASPSSLEGYNVPVDCSRASGPVDVASRQTTEIARGQGLTGVPSLVIQPAGTSSYGDTCNSKNHPSQRYSEDLTDLNDGFDSTTLGPGSVTSINVESFADRHYFAVSTCRPRPPATFYTDEYTSESRHQEQKVIHFQVSPNGRYILLIRQPRRSKSTSEHTPVGEEVDPSQTPVREKIYPDLSNRPSTPPGSSSTTDGILITRIEVETESVQTYVFRPRVWSFSEGNFSVTQDCRYLAYVNAPTVRIFDIVSRKGVLEIQDEDLVPGVQAPLVSCSHGGDKNILAVAVGNMVKLWEINDKAEEGKQEERTRSVPDK
ncbi:Uu.00g083280.m01.CDS01 [Anthostomella pinea]|uniref:Uu.00g083280.m01.CDS01 n=1 Tax=Anthostomella pinea TaxID=933095 RepID=A0AAI8YJM0_9PEZI|nr:Uu.00g083280.m01.CDS01 [Anthostomella pinea]